MRNEIGSREDSWIAKNNAGREEESEAGKGDEKRTREGPGVGNVSHRKPHDMITIADKGTQRESQNGQGLKAMERRKISDKLRADSF
jgi:hypothetical protein